MRRAALLAGALLGAVAGCRTLQPAIPLPSEDPRPRALLASLEARAAERLGLRGVARVALDGHGGSSRSNQVLVLQRPARLRVEIRGLLDQTLAVLVTDGALYDFFRAGDRSRESGPVHPGLLWEWAGVALTPEQAVDLLLGAPAPPPGLALFASLAGDGGVQVDLFTPTGALNRRYSFDATGRLRTAAAFAGDAVPLWEARFDAYAEVGGSAFAHEILLRFPILETRAEVRFRSVELNPDLPPDVFVLKIPAEG